MELVKGFGIKIRTNMPRLYLNTVVKRLNIIRNMARNEMHVYSVWKRVMVLISPRWRRIRISTPEPFQ